MSRIGRSPVQIPDKVKIDVQDGNLVTVEGPKGKLTQALHPEMQIEMEEGVMMVKRPSDSQAHRSLHGLTRALLNNMVVGVSTGFSKTLQIEGVGYRGRGIEVDGVRVAYV